MFNISKNLLCDDKKNTNKGTTDFQQKIHISTNMYKIMMNV